MLSLWWNFDREGISAAKKPTEALKKLEIKETISLSRNLPLLLFIGLASEPLCLLPRQHFIPIARQGLRLLCALFFVTSFLTTRRDQGALILCSPRHWSDCYYVTEFSRIQAMWFIALTFSLGSSSRFNWLYICSQKGAPIQKLFFSNIKKNNSSPTKFYF